MKRLLAALGSTRLAIVTLSYLAVACVLSTLVPHSRFFSSPAFILPAFLFFANLSTCTARRFVAQLRRKGFRRFGPDILHVGLMVLVLGSVWSVGSRQEGAALLTVGQSVNLPDGSVLRLDDFRFERYPDGRPRDWVSVVSIQKQGQTALDHRDIRVNAPLSYAGLTFYQSSYQTMPDGRLATGIEAVADHGYPLVVVALILVALGASITFIQKIKDLA